MPREILLRVAQMTAEPKDILKDDFLSALVSSGVLDVASAGRVRAASVAAGASIERSVLELGLADEMDVYRALAEFLDLPFVGPTEMDESLPSLLGLKQDFLERTSVMPVSQNAAGVTFATSDPENVSVFQSLGFYLSVPIRKAIATPSTLNSVLSGSTPTDDAEAAAQGDVERLKALANDGPVIKFVNDLVAKAVSERASDIHIEAQETGARVRLRIDGLLGVDSMISPDRRAAVVSRLKVMAGLNISEKRRPQDGRLTIPVRGRNVDVRVSTLPTQFGESVVLRLLDQSRVELEWDSLGFQPGRVGELQSVLKSPNGILLVAGPTGSGKTTTLYTALKEINNEDRKIVTVEDPIEYSLPGINQTQVEPAIEMTFARALRAILRQDPDVVMVGEIRDQETAEIAVRAALIGRLVLSTIHTNDSLSAITRLLDLGVPGYLLADTLRGVLSQRLVGRVCGECEGSGCEQCDSKGRKGRQVISEFLPVTPNLARGLSEGADQFALRELARNEGLRSMESDAESLIGSGLALRADVERALGTTFFD